MKRCPKCNTTKDKSEFNRNKSKPDGLQNYCKICQAMISQAYNNSEKGQSRIRRYKSTPKFKIKNKIWQKRYSQTEQGKLSNIKKVRKYERNNPYVKKAHDAVYYAKKIGKLPNLDNLDCIVCSDQAEHYHHHKGYDKKHWLDVIPVCHNCHMTIHNP